MLIKILVCRRTLPKHASGLHDICQGMMLQYSFFKPGFRVRLCCDSHKQSDALML